MKPNCGNCYWSHEYLLEDNPCPHINFLEPNKLCQKPELHLPSRAYLISIIDEQAQRIDYLESVIQTFKQNGTGI